MASEPKIFMIKSMLEDMALKYFKYLRDKKMTDVVLQAQDKFFPCHRMVLSGCSKYFEQIFLTTPPEKLPNPIFIENVDAETMKMLIIFAYTGRSLISLNNVNDILHASSILKFDDLAEMCWKYIDQEVAPSLRSGERPYVSDESNTQIVYVGKDPRTPAQ